MHTGSLSESVKGGGELLWLHVVRNFLLRRQYLEFATEPGYGEHIAMLFGFNW